MPMRLAFCFFTIAVFVSVSAVSANRRSSGVGGQSSVKPGTGRERTSVNAGSYRSAGRLHKAVVSTDDPDALAQAKASGAFEIADYGSFRLLAIDENALERAKEKHAGGQKRGETGEQG